MLGAIAGDIIGSIYENVRTKKKDFLLFTPISTYTDDTVLTVAVADAILNGKDYGPTIKSYARRHPLRGYGPRFMLWMLSASGEGYNSLGNGSAMRVSPVAHAFRREEGCSTKPEKALNALTTIRKESRAPRQRHMRSSWLEITLQSKRSATPYRDDTDTIYSEGSTICALPIESI